MKSSGKKYYSKMFKVLNYSMSIFRNRKEEKGSAKGAQKIRPNPYLDFKISSCNRNMDYIYCLRYTDDKAVQNNSKALEVNETTVECNLSQRQRSSQEILDFADYLLMHSNFAPVRKCDLKSFSSAEIPVWIELDNPESFFEYFESNISGACNDVMLSWDGGEAKPSNLSDIEEYCRYKKWRCTEVGNIIGSEASCVILYDLYWFQYEYLTRAKVKLIIVTIQKKEKRYVMIS